MKKKIKKLVNVIEKVNKADNLVFNLLSDKAYDKYVGPWIDVVDDLCFLVLFGEDYWTVHESYNCPGDDDGKKPVAWSSGFLPEKILDVLKSDRNKKDKVEILLSYMETMKKIDKDWNKLNNN